MSNHSTVIVAQITLGDGTIYYVCSADYMGGITLTSQLYSPFIASINDVEKIGNFDGDFQVGSCGLTVLFGQEQYQGAYNLSAKKPWNNGICEIRICDPTTDTTWATCEYYFKGVIKNFSIEPAQLSFSIDDIDARDDVVMPTGLVDIATYPNAHKDSLGKRIPIQMGDLSIINSTDGIFAKGLLVNTKIGEQQIVFTDKENLNILYNIGVWEEGLGRYFVGKVRSIVGTEVQGEYEVSTGNKAVVFKVDSAATLTADISDTDTNIPVSSYALMQWKDEDEVTDWQTYPELLSTNIISIDNELMMIVEKPTVTNIIIVERGYNNTTAVAHLSVGNTKKIYQSSKFAAKNLLSFTERFDVKAVSNQWYQSGWGSLVTNGSYSNITNSDNSDYIEFIGDALANIINFDLKFNNIENDYSVYDAFIAIKFSANINNEHAVNFGVYDPSFNSARDQSDKSDGFATNFFGSGYVETKQYDSFSTIIRSSTITDPATDYFIPSLRLTTTDQIVTTSLSELNNKWKFSIWIVKYGSIRVYNLGLWCDFFIDFTSRRICGNLTGPNNQYAATICFGSSALANNLCARPLAAIVWLLYYNGGYDDIADYDTTKFIEISAYLANYFGEQTAHPAIAFSYGIDESEKLFPLCTEIASHFCMSLQKTDEGKITAISLHHLQNNNVALGYPSLTHYGISIDDIIVSGGSRLLAIQQTGTDMLYNDVIVKYKRNNSTDEYSSDPYVVLDSYVLPESGITLAAARTLYFNGQKRTKEIESKFIYNALDAQRLAEWHINDKAEVFFWLECTIPYYHYSDVNSKTTQYFIGDIIYLDGVYQDITFNSDKLFVIRNIKKIDQGRAIKIEAKSIKPISEF